ncbi:MAG: PepSY-associated TM helix domain-containing protein [Bacteroidetes bacterium]|nr:PepSY-associated TM helix domain-containing protein [Bacteroidota bacterium]
MKFKWRKWNRATHRDLGYFFVGMIIIYSVSGIAINHLEAWNPNYIIKLEDHAIEPIQKEDVDKAFIENMLAQYDGDLSYKNHYFPRPDLMKVFIKGGIVIVNMDLGFVTIERTSKRPFFNQVNFLHYDPKKWWTLFSDVFAVALVFMAISGLFILKGKNGLKWRGTILTVAGLILPIVFLLFFRK